MIKQFANIGFYQNYTPVPLRPCGTIRLKYCRLLIQALSVQKIPFASLKFCMLYVTSKRILLCCPQVRDRSIFPKFSELQQK